MSVNARELRARRAELIEQAQEMSNQAEIEDRDLTDEEQEQFDGKIAEADALETRAKRIEDMAGMVEILNARQAPAHNKTKPGDTEERAWAHWARTGDDGGIKEFRASNDTTMNITTDADGGYAVPTGHYQGIIASAMNPCLPRLCKRAGFPALVLPLMYRLIMRMMASS